MAADKRYCASSFLMYRNVVDENKTFYDGLPVNRWHIDFERTGVSNGKDLMAAIEYWMKEFTGDGKAALCLSGGIDSAILAKFMPKGSTAYTFQCIVPGIEVTNEVPQAAKYAEECGLKQIVVPMYWEDMEQYTPLLMRHKGSPISSIEVQIYKAALQAKKDGFDKLIFGQASDVLYGGLSGLLSKDRTLGEFIERYSYVMPYAVLKDWEMPIQPFLDFMDEKGYIDSHNFCAHVHLEEAADSYINACECAGIQMLTPYIHTYMSVPMDYSLIRSGKNKYIVRDVFEQLYPDFEIPAKVPMPRATNEWFKDWDGPVRDEFWPHCTDHMTGDQKWMVWCLEKFFDLFER